MCQCVIICIYIYTHTHAYIYICIYIKNRTPFLSFLGLKSTNSCTSGRHCINSDMVVFGLNTGISKHLHCLEHNTVFEGQSGCQEEGKRDSSNGMMQFILNHHCLFYLTWPLFDPSLCSRMSCRPHPLTLPVEVLCWKESCTRGQQHLQLQQQ